MNTFIRQASDRNIIDSSWKQLRRMLQGQDQDSRISVLCDLQTKTAVWRTAYKTDIAMTNLL